MEGTISPNGYQSYKEVRERFVQNLNGTSMGEIMLLSSFLPVMFTFLPVLFRLCMLSKLIPVKSQRDPATPVFFVEFFTGVLPVVLVFTVLSDFATMCLTVSCVMLVILMRILYVIRSPDNRVGYWNHSADIGYLPGKQPFITYFRAGTFLLTAISILAVDFHVYPRRFAKTEAFGVSYMDLGVGLFIMSSALVQDSKRSIRWLSESAVFLCLGVLRYLSIQKLDYQTHVTEYGLHWNFFITLGLMKPISYLIQSLSGNRNLLCGLLLMILNQYLTSTFFASYVLGDTGRENWLDANREGLVSLTGFVCIHLFGCSIANLVQQLWRIKKKLSVLSMFWTISVVISISAYFCDRYLARVSRRLANLPYVLWVVAHSMVVLSSCIGSQLLLTHFLPILPRKRNKIYGTITPAILENANRNGLPFFVVCNLLTGLLNVCLDLYSLSTPSSMFILIVYMMVSCVAVYEPYLINLKLKFGLNTRS